MASVNAQRSLQGTTNSLRENMAQLSSGYRINKAADDAAGMAISNNMTGKIRSLEQATRNANDGISLVQVAEGSMNEVSNILIRLRELATQSASDTIGNAERSFTNREYTALVDEIERITNTTEFNGVKLLQGSENNTGSDLLTIHVGAGDGVLENTDTIRLNIDEMKLDPADLGLGKEDEIGPLEISGDFDRTQAAEKLTVLDTALQTVATTRANLGAQQSRLQSSIANLGIQVENLKSANSRIRDVDFAGATAQFTQNRILSQAGISVLSQANAEPEAALALLR